MPDPPAALYLDEDVSVVVAAILRGRGFDAVTTRDLGQLGLSDNEQLAHATRMRRALLTHNRADFERLHSEWLGVGRHHTGIIIARRRLPTEIVARVGRLLTRLAASEVADQLLYI